MLADVVDPPPLTSDAVQVVIGTMTAHDALAL
jgi:hypothetical protein